MKNLVKFCNLPLALFFFMQINTALLAQQNALKFIMPLNGNWAGHYERVLNTKTSITAELQKWNQDRSRSNSTQLLGITESHHINTEVKGFRMEIMLRSFAKSALNGWFAEGGLYFGTHDLTVSDKTTSVSPYPLFFGDLDKVYEENTTTTEYKNVRVGGIKAGGGFEKCYGHFSLEVSGGLNFNAFNSQNVRPVLPLKGVSPYLRVGMGVAF